MTKHQAAIYARMRRTGEGYMAARRAYLEEMNMPVGPPSTKDARRRAARKAALAQDAAVFAEYGAALGVDPPPEIAALLQPTDGDGT